jgi:hypothetical protein
MPHLRFETARDLFDSFALIREELQLEPTDDRCLDFVRSLYDEGEVAKAVGVCAYLLPRREAVWWACRSVRGIAPPRSAEENECFAAAEEWVQDPEEERRLAALKIGTRSDYRSPATLVARAAGYAGNTFPVGPDAWAPVQPEQTPRAVRGAILTAVAHLPPEARTDALRRCLDEAVRLATAAERQ